MHGDWRKGNTIDNLIQDIEVIHKDLTSDEFKQNTYAKLIKSCKNKEVVNLMWDKDLST